MSRETNTTLTGRPFTVFAFVYGLYLIAHHIYLFNGTGFDKFGLSISSIFLAGGFALILWPQRGYAFVFAATMHFLQTLWLMPIHSNHTIISLFLAFGFVAAYAHVALRTRAVIVNGAGYFEAFAPLGRWLLIIMYFYGTLHKVNTDFLNPLTSCAVSIWQRYGFPHAIAESPIIHSTTMYGTLLVETTAIILLLTRRFRWWGIILGITFHGFLGFVPPGKIVAYSLLAIALHSLFLPQDALDRFARGTLWRRLNRLLTRLLPRFIIITSSIAIAALLPWQVTWALLLLLIVFFIFAYGSERKHVTAQVKPWLVSPASLVNVIALLFFLNGVSPYLGFKTGQTISMFSNLITEGGRSNHLLVPNIQIFDYQHRIATIIKTDQPILAKWRSEGYKMVEYQVLDYLERTPGTQATFIVDGTTYRHTPTRPLATIVDLPPRWLRKLMVFRPVILKSPKKCDSY
jgi:hypothetical protein